MPSCGNECNKVNIGQYVKKNHVVATHNMLCLVNYYHFIAQADILANNWQHGAQYCP